MLQMQMQMAMDFLRLLLQKNVLDKDGNKRGADDPSGAVLDELVRRGYQRADIESNLELAIANSNVIG